MARKSPNLQSRSLVHSYWGQFPYDTTTPPDTYEGRTGDVGGAQLPNVAAALSLSEFAKLEAGDIAATISEADPIAGSEFGFWFCIFPGVAGVGGAVWIRLDATGSGNTTQTIRDAHRIVVGIAGLTTGTPATDTLLNLSPYTAGVSADFIDTGDGAGLALAIATATAMGNPVDVRIVSGGIDLEAGLITTPLVVPSGCRIIGAGSSQTEIEGRDTADQGIFFMSANTALEGLSLVSKAPTATPGTSIGIVQSTGVQGGDFKLRDISITIQDESTPARVARVGVYAVAAGSGAPKSCDMDRVSVAVDGSIATAGFNIEGYVGSNIENCSTTGAHTGLRFSGGLGPSIPGNAAGHISNFRGWDILEGGILVENIFGQASIFGLSISDSFVKFSTDGDETDPQYVIRITTDTNCIMDQISVSGLQAHWPANAQAANRRFGWMAAGSGGRIKGLRFVNCGATSGLAYSSSLTLGLHFDSVDNESIRGTDLGCDFAGLGLTPAEVINVLGGTVAWEHAHSSGLA